MVCGQAECLQRLHVDPLVAVGLDDLGRGVAEAHALLHQALRDAKPGGDFGDAGAGGQELREGRDLICRVHGEPDRVLGERDLLGRRVDEAMMQGIGWSRGPCLRRRGPRGREAPAAGEDGKRGLPSLADRLAHDQVLEEAVVVDRGLQLGLGALARRRRADVFRREEEMGKGNVWMTAAEAGVAMGTALLFSKESKRDRRKSRTAKALIRKGLLLKLEGRRRCGLVLCGVLRVWRFGGEAGLRVTRGRQGAIADPGILQGRAPPIEAFLNWRPCCGCQAAVELCPLLTTAP